MNYIGDLMVCPQCGKKFARESFNQWYCSKECQQESKKDREKHKPRNRKKERMKGYKERMQKKDETLMKAMELHMTYGKYQAMLYAEEMERVRKEKGNNNG